MASALPVPDSSRERALLCLEEPPVRGFFVGERRCQRQRESDLQRMTNRAQNGAQMRASLRRSICSTAQKAKTPRFR